MKITCLPLGNIYIIFSLDDFSFCAGLARTDEYIYHIVRNCESFDIVSKLLSQDVHTNCRVCFA